MKKIFILTLLLPIMAFADDLGITAPEWKSFAPSAFVDVKEPKGLLGKMNVSATYWYNRRKEFESGLADCQELNTNDERFTCYEKLKITQYKLNSSYNAQMEAKQQGVNPAIPEMRNNTDTMLPLNINPLGFMQMQPSEFN